MRKQNNIIRILIFVFAGLIALTVIGGGIYLFLASKQLKSIELQPQFSETSLEVGTQYTFKINTKPSKASIKKAKAEVSDSTSSIEINDKGEAVLTTGMTEGDITIFVECKGIKSQVLSYSIVDSVARAQAEAAAQAEAQREAEEAEAEQAAAEAEMPAKMYVRCKGDDVNVRSTNSTDGDVLGKAKKGEMFEKVEDVDDWTHIKYNDQDGYMKTEFLETISEEEYQTGGSEGDTADTGEEKKEEEKKDDKKEENKTEEQTTDANATQTDANAGTTQTKEEAEAKAKADAEKQAAEELAAQAAALQQQAATSTAGLTPINCKDGTCYLTPAQIGTVHATWDYAGDALEMATHHSIAELEAVVGATQH